MERSPGIPRTGPAEEPAAGQLCQHSAVPGLALPRAAEVIKLRQAATFSVPKSPARQHGELRRCTGLSERLSSCHSARFWNAGRSMAWSGLAIRNWSLPAALHCLWRAGGLTAGLRYCISGASKTIPTIATCHHSPGQRPAGLAGMLCALCVPEVCCLLGSTYPLSISV